MSRLNESLESLLKNSSIKLPGQPGKFWSGLSDGQTPELTSVSLTEKDQTAIPLKIQFEVVKIDRKYY